VDNPFASDDAGGLVTNIRIDEVTGEAGDSCITYAYNRDDDFPALVGGSTSLDPTVFDSNNTEMYGFRLRGGAIEMRTGMGTDSTFDCNSGAWQDLTDGDIVNINSLTFGLASTGQRNVTDGTRNDFACATGTNDDDPDIDDLIIEVREVQISMTGASTNDVNLTFTLEQVVDLPNDRAFFVTSQWCP